MNRDAVVLPASLRPERLDQLRAAVRGTGAPEPVILPFTGEPFTELAQSPEADLVLAAARAPTAQRESAAVDAGERAAIGIRLHDLIIDRGEELVDVIQAEAGKARNHAYLEVLEVALLARFLGRVAASTLRTRALPGAVPFLTRVRQRPAPVGLFGLISPWNYPLSLGVGDGLAALFAGNALLHRPDGRTVLTAALGRELIIEAGLPADLWQLVTGPGDRIG